MKVTVAICTWNRAQLLDQTLAQMANLRIPDDVEWELLVVNNNSTDDTDEVIAKYRRRVPVRRIWEPRAGLSCARNVGIDQANADWLIFTDDDVLVSESWLSEYVKAMDAASAEVGILGGPIEPWFQEWPDDELMAAFPMVRNGFCGVVIPDELEFDVTTESTPLGANFAIRRSLVGNLRFLTHLGVCRTGRVTGEEVQFLRQLLDNGVRGRWVPDAKLKHYVPRERIELPYLRRHLIGMGRSSVRNRWPLQKPFHSIPRWTYRQCLESFVMMLRHRLAGNRFEYLECFKHAYLGYGQIAEALSLTFNRTKSS